MPQINDDMFLVVTRDPWEKDHHILAFYDSSALMHDILINSLNNWQILFHLNMSKHKIQRETGGELCHT